MSLEEKYKIKNILFSLAWCLLLLQVLYLDSRFPQPDFRITFPCFLLLCLAAVFPFRYSFREILILGFLGILTLLVCYKSKFNILIWVYAFVACSKGIPLRPILFKTLIIYLIMFFGCILCSQLGLIEDATRSYGSSQTLLKHSLGMGDANTAHAILLIIICLVLALYYERLHISHLFLLIFVNSGLLAFTLCKTSAGIIYFILIAAICEKKLKPLLHQRIYNVILIFLFIGLFSIVALTTFGPIFYNGENKIYMELNHLFTGRFYLAKEFFNHYRILPFGNMISEFFAEPRTQYLDFGYSVLLLQFGYIYTIIFICGYIALYWHFFHSKNFAGILVISSVLLFMSSENIMTIIFYNFSYFWFRDFIFQGTEPYTKPI